MPLNSWKRILYTWLELKLYRKTCSLPYSVNIMSCINHDLELKPLISDSNGYNGVNVYAVSLAMGKKIIETCSI